MGRNLLGLKREYLESQATSLFQTKLFGGSRDSILRLNGLLFLELKNSKAHVTVF